MLSAMGNLKYAARCRDVIQLSSCDFSVLIHMHFTCHLYRQSLRAARYDANQEAASVCKWKLLNAISVHIRLKELMVGYL